MKQPKNRNQDMPQGLKLGMFEFQKQECLTLFLFMGEYFCRQDLLLIIFGASKYFGCLCHYSSQTEDVLGQYLIDASYYYFLEFGLLSATCREEIVSAGSHHLVATSHYYLPCAAISVQFVLFSGERKQTLGPILKLTPPTIISWWHRHRKATHLPLPQHRAVFFQEKNLFHVISCRGLTLSLAQSSRSCFSGDLKAAALDHHLISSGF